MPFATNYPLATTGTPVSVNPEWPMGVGVFFVTAITSGTAVLQWSPDSGANWIDVPESALSAIGYRNFSLAFGLVRLKPAVSTGVTAAVADNVEGGAVNASSSASPTTTTPAPLPASTDRSGSITTGGTAQQLAAANAARTKLNGQNISAGDLWINESGGTATANASGSYQIPAGATFNVNTNRAVSIVGATTGQKFTATES